MSEQNLKKQKDIHYELQENLHNAMIKANIEGLDMVHILHVALYLVTSEVYKSAPTYEEAELLITSTIKEIKNEEYKRT